MGAHVAREHTGEEQYELLADLTAMLTLALLDERDELDEYVDEVAVDAERIKSLLGSAMVLYAEAFARLGIEQGFDPLTVTRRIALIEARERWGLSRAE